jgi:thioredoxin-dependent peroxiredoxin
MLEERHDEAYEGSECLTVVGRKLQPGDVAPDFELDYLDLADSTVHRARLADSTGMIRLLNVVNSLDMPICHMETKRWEELRSDLPPDVCVYTISMDLPYAQARWQFGEGVLHQALSAHRSEQFGQDYGVLIKEWRLLQRAVFVIDREDCIVYAQYINNQMHEPNYEAAMQAAKQAEAN